MATVFSGGTYISANQACTTKWSLMQFIKQQCATNVTNAGWTNLALDNGVGAQGPGNQGTCTITIASPAVVTLTAHGFLGGEKIMFATTIALPTGLSANTVYFVKFVGVNTFNVSSSSGGSNINTSGSQSGVQTVYTQTVLLKSATQANVTNPIVVKLQDNAGNGIQISICNSAFTVNGGNSTSGNAGGSLVPTGSANFQILASQYRFECFLLGSSGNRKFVMAGMSNVPSFVVGTTDHGYMLCDSASDGDTIRQSLRTSMSIGSTGLGTGNSQVIWNGNLLESAGNTGNGNSGCPQFSFLGSLTGRQIASGVDGYYRWENGDIVGSDVFLTSGLSASTDEAKYKGQMYDMEFSGGAFAIDSTDTWSGHNWYNLTNNVVQGGAWIATS